MPTAVAKYKRYINYNLNPVTLDKDENGDYIRSNLEEVKRRYEAKCYWIKTKQKEKEKIVELIEKKESNPRSRYNVLLKKANKTAGEHEELYERIAEIEKLYNKLPLIEREIRDSVRKLRAVFSPHILEIVYSELGEEMKGELNYDVISR